MSIRGAMREMADCFPRRRDVLQFVKRCTLTAVACFVIAFTGFIVAKCLGANVDIDGPSFWIICVEGMVLKMAVDKIWPVQS